MEKEKGEKMVTITLSEYEQLKKYAEKFKNADVIMEPAYFEGCGIKLVNVNICIADEGPSFMRAKDLFEIMKSQTNLQASELKSKDVEINNLRSENRNIQSMSWFDFKVYKHNKKFK